MAAIVVEHDSPVRPVNWISVDGRPNPNFIYARRLSGIRLSPILSAGGSCSRVKVFSACASPACPGLDSSWSSPVARSIVPGTPKPMPISHSAQPTGFLKTNHYVFFLLDVVPQLDLDAFYESYRHWRHAANRPSIPPCSFACCFTPTASACSPAARSPRRANATSPSWPSSVTTVPTSAPSATSARSTWNSLAALFVQVLKLAARAGMVRLGNLAFDGSKFTGQASRHKAMSYGYMLKEEERLKAEIEGAAKTGRKDRRRGGCRPRFSAAATNCPTS